MVTSNAVYAKNIWKRTMKLELLSTFDVDHALLKGRRNRGATINDLRHKGTNYDSAVAGAVPDEYPGIAQSAREAVFELIDKSKCSKYEKYLYQLYNKRWDFYKKSDISQGSQI